MASTTTEENKQLARRAVDGFNEKNLAVVDELFADDVIDHSPTGETKGHDGPKAGLETLYAAFPDLEISIDELIAEGDTVALRSTHRGTHEGPFMDIEPTGKRVEIPNMVFARFEDGKVVERWVQADMLGLMGQLGAVDPEAVDPGAVDPEAVDPEAVDPPGG